MAVSKCPCSTFSNVMFKQMPRSHWFLSINSQYLQPYSLLQQTSQHTKIHTLTPLTYELFFQNSSKRDLKTEFMPSYRRRQNGGLPLAVSCSPSAHIWDLRFAGDSSQLPCLFFFSFVDFYFSREIVFKITFR